MVVRHNQYNIRTSIATTASGAGGGRCTTTASASLLRLLPPLALLLVLGVIWDGVVVLAWRGLAWELAWWMANGLAWRVNGSAVKSIKSVTVRLSSAALIGVIVASWGVCVCVCVCVRVLGVVISSPRRGLGVVRACVPLTAVSRV